MHRFLKENRLRAVALFLLLSILVMGYALLSLLQISGNGNFQRLWLAPEQVRILTVTDRANAWAEEIKGELLKAGIRAEADLRNEKLGAKVRDAQMFKIPYMVILGDKEVDEKLVTPRLKSGENLAAMTWVEFSARLQEEVRLRK